MNRFKDLFDLSGEIAIVIGGASGIGKGISQGLACFGAKVIIFDIDRKKGQETLTELNRDTERIYFKKVNVLDSAQVNKSIQDILTKFGKIDILVNNVGITIRKYAIDMTEEDWDKTLNLNLKSHFICAKAVAPSMITRKKGKIIEIGSVSSFLGHPKRVAYASSKGGIRLMIKVLAREWSQYNINVNGIAPGFIKTPLTADLFSNEKEYQNIICKIPLGKVGLPEDLVGTAVFLASKASNYLSGQLILVDGGRTID